MLHFDYSHPPQLPSLPDWVKFTIYALLKYTYLKMLGLHITAPCVLEQKVIDAQTSIASASSRVYCPVFPFRTKSIHKWHYYDAKVRLGWWLWTSPPCWPQGDLVFMASHSPTSREEAVKCAVLIWTPVWSHCPAQLSTENGITSQKKPQLDAAHLQMGQPLPGGRTSPK